jgi:hypothetical protein
MTWPSRQGNVRLSLIDCRFSLLPLVVQWNFFFKIFCRSFHFAYPPNFCKKLSCTLVLLCFVKKSFDSPHPLILKLNFTFFEPTLAFIFTFQAFHYYYHSSTRSHVHMFTCSHVDTLTRSHVHTFTRSHVHTFTRSHVHTFTR